uniref:Transposase Tnp1/En/Spm-like domain-containing protein n=1 Tax=Oryza brachyantha TaxID=4533 RepID=J3KUE6_ORYBR
MAPGRKMLDGKNKPARPPSVLPDPAASPCLTPRSKTMAQGQKALGCKNTHSHPPSVLPDDAAAMEMPEEEDMDLSTLRARNIMRNNRFANQLGIRKLAQIFQSSIAKKKAVGNMIGKKSKAMLLGEDVANTGDCVTTGTGRTSKRVLAPENLEETMRCTRQRAMKQVSTTSLIEATEVGLEPDLSTNHNQGDTSNTEQGNLTLSTELEPMGLSTTEQANRQVEPRGNSMGKEIDSISRGLGTMIPIIVKKGKRRPEAPMQAAKLALESGIIIRQHIPIYPSWTDYKKDSSQLDNLKGKLKGKFSIDIHNDPVIAAVEDILRCGTRQMRYRFKKKYFDGVRANQVRTTSPLKCMTDEQWTKLVDMWSSPEHKGKCAKNQLNHETVQFQQRTGSRSYIAHAYVVKQEKYKDSEPTAIDLFEELHCSKTKGFSEPVKKAIDDMHAREALTSPSVEDGQQAKTSIDFYQLH